MLENLNVLQQGHSQPLTDGSGRRTYCPALRPPSSLWRVRRDVWLSHIQNCAFHWLRDESKKSYKRKLTYNQNWTHFPPEIRCAWEVEWRADMGINWLPLQTQWFNPVPSEERVLVSEINLTRQNQREKAAANPSNFNKHTVCLQHINWVISKKAKFRMCKGRK